MTEDKRPEATVSRRDWSREYVRQEKESDAAFLATIQTTGDVDRLSRSERVRYMRLTGAWAYGRQGMG
jgi:hypothetical protein